MELGARRVLERPGDWTRTQMLNLLVEDFEVADQVGRSRLLMPGIDWTRIRADNNIRPTRGSKLELEVRGAQRRARLRHQLRAGDRARQMDLVAVAEGAGPRARRRRRDAGTIVRRAAAVGALLRGRRQQRARLRLRGARPRGRGRQGHRRRRRSRSAASSTSTPCASAGRSRCSSTPATRSKARHFDAKSGCRDRRALAVAARPDPHRPRASVRRPGHELASAHQPRARSMRWFSRALVDPARARHARRRARGVRAVAARQRDRHVVGASARARAYGLRAHGGPHERHVARRLRARGRASPAHARRARYRPPRALVERERGAASARSRSTPPRRRRRVPPAAAARRGARTRGRARAAVRGAARRRDRAER